MMSLTPSNKARVKIPGRNALKQISHQSSTSRTSIVTTYPALEADLLLAVDWLGLPD